MQANSRSHICTGHRGRNRSRCRADRCAGRVSALTISTSPLAVGSMSPAAQDPVIATISRSLSFSASRKVRYGCCVSRTTGCRLSGRMFRKQLPQIALPASVTRSCEPAPAEDPADLPGFGLEPAGLVGAAAKAGVRSDRVDTTARRYRRRFSLATDPAGVESCSAVIRPSVPGPPEPLLNQAEP